jgi:hypothetical protein
VKSFIFGLIVGMFIAAEVRRIRRIRARARYRRFIKEMLDVDVDTIAQTIDAELQLLLHEEKLKKEHDSQWPPRPETKNFKKLNDETSSTLNNISKKMGKDQKKNIPPKFGRNFWPDWEV